MAVYGVLADIRRYIVVCVVSNTGSYISNTRLFSAFLVKSDEFEL
jgi:hypothetical protein